LWLLALWPSDALAWGLQTHLYFAQYALALLPLADPGLRAAARRLPGLVLAGACLPDLAIVGLLMGTLGILARGDAVLRASPVPALCRAAFGTKRFDAYLAQTVQILGRLDQALGGGFEDWCGSDPEGSGGDQGAERCAGEHVARIVQPEHHA
jgi:hypothetical protein